MKTTLVRRVPAISSALLFPSSWSLLGSWAFSSPSCLPNKLPSAQPSRISLLLVAFAAHIPTMAVFLVEKSNKWVSLHMPLTLHSLCQDCQGPNFLLSRSLLPVASRLELLLVEFLTSLDKFLRVNNPDKAKAVGTYTVE